MNPEQMVVFAIATVITMGLVAAAKALFPSLLKKGSAQNKALPFVALVVGVAVMVLKAWWLSIPIRSAEGWQMIVVEGVTIGLVAGGLRSSLRAMVRTE